MLTPDALDRCDVDVSSEIARLQAIIDRLTQENSDLQIALQTTAEHGDEIERQLYDANQQLRSEIVERERAQATLQTILETVTKDNEDLQLILETTTQHGDTVEYQLYTQAVEAMRASEQLLQAIAESTTILMILTQQVDGAISYANPISGQKLGISLEHLTAYRLHDFFVDPDDFHDLKVQLDQVGAVYDSEIQVQRQDGHQFWVSVSMCSIAWQGSQVLLTTLYDISDRKQAELQLQRQAEILEQRVEQRTLELQQAEQKYRSIFENAVEGIFQVSLDGRYLSANPALATMYGYQSPAHLLQAVTNIGHQLYVQSQRRDEMVAYLRRFGSVVAFESQVYRQDGTTIWISENVRTVQDGDGTVLYYEGSVRNVTERRLMEQQLRQQQQASERLLLNVLPQVIAEQLKRGQRTIADYFAEATVLFADIVNFTKLSAQTPPDEVVNLLNQIFSEFDVLVDRYQLEKIKTIGDAYMVVGGVPTPNANHIAATADLALAMLNTIDTFQTHYQQPVTLRIGMHTGPVIAGVIGKRRLIYDLWGDTVNVASRMESQGSARRIQVTDPIYQRLKGQYRFQDRGEIAVKGRGLMKTYWLMGPQTPPGP